MLAHMYNPGLGGPRQEDCQELRPIYILRPCLGKKIKKESVPWEVGLLDKFWQPLAESGIGLGLSMGMERWWQYRMG